MKLDVYWEYAEWNYAYTVNTQNEIWCFKYAEFLMSIDCWYNAYSDYVRIEI